MRGSSHTHGWITDSKRAYILDQMRGKNHSILLKQYREKEIMKQPSQTHPRDSQHPENQKNNKSLKQAIEEVLRKNGLEPKWDYSKAGQSVIMPTRRNHGGSPGTKDSQSPEKGK